MANLPRRSPPRIVPSRFATLLARCRADTRNGYQQLGRAVMRELPKLSARFSTPSERLALGAAIAERNAKEVVRWLVINAPQVMRHVPRERRYASFQRGIASELATTWSRN